MLDPPAQRLGGGVRARPRQLRHPAPALPFELLLRLPESRVALPFADVNRFEVNSPEVIEESVDGEVLIVHLGTGAYYSSDGAGEFIWRRVIAGHTTAEVANAVTDHFGVAESTASAAVERMIGQYVEEGLIRERAGRPIDDVPAAESATFEEPVLNKYTDMEELLLLDPVHDVEEAGWPHARPDLNRA